MSGLRHGAQENRTEPSSIDELPLSQLLENFTVLELRGKKAICCDFEFIYLYKFGQGEYSTGYTKNTWRLSRQFRLDEYDAKAVDEIWKLARKYREKF